MSLRSYVLAARLEEVAVAATHRLRTMSQGRYAFVHSDAAGARGTRGGLGIDVLDDYSGTIRPAKTLSGGESFLASLALALGLADVVAGETGGALLDTLFVDEGFGTLDAETLDVVMNILDELRAAWAGWSGWCRTSRSCGSASRRACGSARPARARQWRCARAEHSAKMKP